MAILATYFGCLNEAQALRYFYSADAKFLLAVMLVQHNLYYAEAVPLDPESDGTHTALKWAATSAGHLFPNILAQVMAIWPNKATSIL